MKTSIFQEKNLKTPEEVFNFLGNQQFGEEWTERPLQILQGVQKKSKPTSESFLRNKYMADQTFKKFSQFVKEDDVTIYAPSKSWDEKPDCNHILEWKHPHFRISKKDFFLIEQEILEGYESLDMTRRYFWIEMPKENNPMSFKKPGRKPVHDKAYLLSILKDVCKLITGKTTYRSVADAYEDYYRAHNIKKPFPSKSWVETNLAVEIKQIKENEGF